jgi:hypothetical protein
MYANKGAISSSGSNVSSSAGTVVEPSWTYNVGSGSVTVGDGTYRLYHSTDWTGVCTQHVLAGDTFSFAEGSSFYVVAKYNSGAPFVDIITDVSEINFSNVIPIFTISRFGDLISGFTLIDWSTSALGTANKLLVRLIKTQRFARQEGLELSIDSSLNVTIAPGIVWNGIYDHDFVESVSNVNECFERVWNGTSWDRNAVTTLNNTQYNGVSGLVNLTTGRYAVVWVYKDMGSSNPRIHLFQGTGDYTLVEAQNSQPPVNIPAVFGTDTIQIGRIIILKGATTATQVDLAWNTIFSPSVVTNHASLSGLQGGSVGSYYHSNQNVNTTADVQFTSVTGVATTNNGTTNMFVGKDSDDATVFYVDSDGKLTAPKIKPLSDGTTAIIITKADGTTSLMNFDTTNTITTVNLDSVDNAAFKVASGGSSNCKVLNVGASGTTFQGTNQSGDLVYNLRTYGNSYHKNSLGVGVEAGTNDKVTVKGTTADGTTNIINGLDSTGASMFKVDTDGNVTANSYTGTINGLAPSNYLYVGKNGNDSTGDGSVGKPFLTWTAAINAASSGTTIFGWPGSYTENLTFKAGVNLTTTAKFAVTITGNHTANFSGTIIAENIVFVSATGVTLTYSGSSSQNLQFIGSDINSGSGDAINWTNTNASSKLTLQDSNVSVGTSGASARAFYCTTGAAGSVIANRCSIRINNPDNVALSIGGAVSFTHTSDQVVGQMVMSGTASLTSSLCSHTCATQPVLTTNSSGASTFLDCIEISTAIPIVTGAGVFVYAASVFGSTGKGGASTLNGGAGALPLDMSPIKLRSGAFRPVPVDGMLEYDGTNLTFTVNNTRHNIAFSS